MNLIDEAAEAAARASVARRRAAGRALWVWLPFALGVAVGAAGCTVVGEGILSGDKVDYRSAPVKARPLEVPPDLSQLARESRYQTTAGTVSAAAAGTTAATTATAAGPRVAVTDLGQMRIERLGQQRWLVVPMTPEQLWPQLRAFWDKSGFTLGVDNPQTGVMETRWAENRAKLPNDIIRNTVGRLFNNLYDSGERDLFRTRVERQGNASEVYISHRGVQEESVGLARDSTTWRARASDPGLEAEMLARLMLALSGREDPAAKPAAAGTIAAAPEAPGRARPLDGGTRLEVDEAFDRAWRRVGLALDRGGFTVEDRDRAGGLYYVRYVDPRAAGQEEPNFFARVFGGAKDPQTPVRYRIALKGETAKTTVAVQSSAGQEESGEIAKRIVTQLVAELR